MRGRIRLFVLALALLVCVSRATADSRYLDDATLRAVQFIDEQEGWAVGDEGVILHSLDGGKSWARQPTGLRASLRSVHFVTPEVGWVAGREELPHGGSAGVLLFTRDGGLKWQRQLPGALPGINVVRFADAANGVLLGDGTDQLPTGVFRTNDGGRTWEPAPGPRATSWYAGNVPTDGSMILGGAWARLGKLRPDRLVAGEDVERMQGRDIHGVQTLPRQTFAVGQGGLILSSVSAGAKWGFADLHLPPEVRTCLDFHAIHAAGQHVWIVGRPGSVVLHSSDSGQSWRLQKTGSALPLYGVHFFNEQLGWAVGAAGTILATVDGGATWKPCRQGGSRAAVLVAQAHAQDLPLETLARLGAADGYLTHAVRAVAPDPGSAALNEATGPMRFDGAARMAGAMSAETLWAFALPQYLRGESRDLVLAYWNHRHAGQASGELLRQLVLTLRVWRPGVVIGDNPQCPDAATSLVAEALQEAVRQAADPKAFPEQIELLGLAPWQVGKVYALCDSKTATVTLDNDTVLDVLQATARDYAVGAAALLPAGGTPLPRERGMRLLQTQLTGIEGNHDLMHGLPAKLGEARRDVQPVRLDPEMAKALREKKQLVNLAEQLDDPAAIQARVLPMLAELPEDAAARAVAEVAGQFLRRGRWDLARETFALLVERYPAHALAAPAYRWLIRHDGSSELRRRYELKQFAANSKPGAVAPAINAEPPGKLGAIQLASAAPSGDALAGYRRCLDFGKRLAGFGAMDASDPSMQFCLQAARRGLGDVGKSADWYGKFSTYITQGPWHDAAQAELWLAGRPQPPRKTARCRLTEARPYLDGEFNDACWQGGKPLVLANAVGDTAREYTTQALFAYDQEFLYVAVKCTHPRGKQVPPVKVRPRDAEVTPYDRVSILLDLDRDYATFFHLQIDQRGCVREDCSGDLSWDPRWYVAVKSSEDYWQVEAAIPIGELTGQRIAVDSAWAFNIVRILPGRGVQSWSQPADVQPRPEGMSLLLFKQDAARAGTQPMPKAP